MSSELTMSTPWSLMVMMGLSCDKMSSELTMSTRWSLMVMTELSYDKNEF